MFQRQEWYCDVLYLDTWYLRQFMQNHDEETLKRLEELGIRKEDLKGTLSAVCAQRIYKRKKEREKSVLYEILEKKNYQDTSKTMNLIKPSNHF